MPDPHIIIADQPSNVYYTQGGTPEDTFTIPFAFFDEDDILIYVDQILETNRTINGNPGTSGGFNGGEVVLDTPVSNVDIAILRSVDVERITDFPVSGPFNINQLNTDLDRIIAMIQALRDELNISVRLDLSEDFTLINLVLPGPVSGNVIGWSNDATQVVNLTGLETDVAFINNVISQAVGEAQSILDAFLSITQNVTIETFAPTTQGNDGDIWLVVPA